MTNIPVLNNGRNAEVFNRSVDNGVESYDSVDT